jgi:hypothetical protein
MSGLPPAPLPPTLPTPPPSWWKDAKTIRAWGQVLISFYALTIFGIVAVYSFWENNEKLETVIVGAVVGFIAGVMSFWVGSSIGSQSKDDVIANSWPVGTPPPHA